MALTLAFASQSQAQAIHVRSQLSFARNTTQTATEYFMHIKKLTDDLAFAGQPLNCDDISTYLLAGLGPEYDSLVTTIGARATSLTLKEVLSMLLTCEARIQYHSQSFSSTSPSANVATKQQNLSFYQGRGNQRGRGRGNTSFRSSACGNFSSPNPNNHCCQLCDKPDHTASRCFKRFDPNFLTPPPRQNAQANLSTTQTQTSGNQE
ncbi:hypothetical protein F2P56_027498 [Juglans regia]|uniref:Uncharacterized protein LOC109005777 n=2 Tax=Juglans regia TaxID=51240 RepID=A0A2I4G902_JUGRE|nr:uncharacterized protein LOC109005777 [Juglans regia]KAF5452511.1 hypothetical protein F2P56_027498 [Juglans regia]